MPIEDYVFTDVGNGVCLPKLNIRLHKPGTEYTYKTDGIIDTGSTLCAIPYDVGELLGYRIGDGTPHKILTANGEITAYMHKIDLEVYQQFEENILFSLSDITISFMPNVQDVLLGARDFLNGFDLTVCYPARKFSLKINDKVPEHYRACP